MNCCQDLARPIVNSVRYSLELLLHRLIHVMEGSIGLGESTMSHLKGRHAFREKKAGSLKTVRVENHRRITGCQNLNHRFVMQRYHAQDSPPFTQTSTPQFVSSHQGSLTAVP